MLSFTQNQQPFEELVMAFRLHHLALAAAALVAQAGAQATTYQWIQPSSGAWSNAASWADGLVPPAGGAADATLVFGRPAPAPTPFTYTVTNDLPGVFALNRLEMAGNTSATLQLTQASGSGLMFTGPGATLAVTGVAAHTLASPTSGLGVNLDSDLTVEVGRGQLTLSAPLSGTGALIVNGYEGSYFAGGLTLSGNASSFSGGVTLNSGNLWISAGNASATPLGSGPLTINGGVLTSGSTATRINGPLVLNNDLRLANGVLTVNGGSTVGNSSAALRVQGGTMNLNNALDIQGATVIGEGQYFYPNAGPAVLTLGGNNGLTSGTLLQTSAIDIGHGGTLNIDNGSSSTGNLADRVNDAAAVSLRSGMISFRAAAEGSSETLGATSVAGFSVLESRPGTGTGGQAGVLTLASLERVDHGVLFVRGQNLGDAAAANRGVILVGGSAPALVGGGGAAGSTNVSIVPWAVANWSTTSSTGNANSFATYDAVNGFRALNTATEFASALGGNATDNVFLSASTTNDADVTVNALNIGTADVGGHGTVHVTSGAVLYSGSNTRSFTNGLDFGSAEGVFTTTSTIEVSGNMTGSGGFTKSGNFNLVLSGDNRGLSGPLTIASSIGTAGRIDVGSANALPGTGAITIYGGYVGAAGIGVRGVATIDRDIVVKTGQAGLTTLTSNGSSYATFSGNISGDGGVSINSGGGWDVVELTGQNTYKGATRLDTGFLIIHSDANLGDGGALVLDTATDNQGLELAGDWTTSRAVHANSLTGINTREHDAVLNGLLTGSANLTKIGTGSLTINGSGPFEGILNIYQGSLFVNGTIAANVFFDGDVMGGSGRVGDVNFLGTFDVGSGPDGFGTFSAASMTMLLGSTVVFDLGHDLLAIDNVWARADEGFGSQVTFDFSDLAGVAAGATYDLVSFGGTNFSVGDFAYVGGHPGLSGEFVMNGQTLQFAVAAVPEPGTYAMLLAGLAVVGRLARRRRG